MLRSRLRARHRREVRKLAQRDVDLEARARIVESLHTRDEIRGEIFLVAELEEGDVRVGTRHDFVAANLGAVLEHDTNRATVLHQHLRNFGVHSNLRALRLGGTGDRVADPTHPAAHVAPHAAHAVALTHDMVKEHVRGAGHRRRGHRADYGIGRERDLEILRLEPAIENRTRGASENLDRGRALGSHLLELPGELAEVAEIGGAHVPWAWWRLHERRLDEVRAALEHRLVLGERVRILARELAHLAVRHLLVGAHHERAAVEEWRERRWTARQQLEAKAMQLELLDDLRTQQAVDVGGGRHLVAGPDLFSHACAADELTSLEHAYGFPCAREIRCTDERVVAPADQNDVVALRHR